ncbi:MAG: hydrogenase 4 subunit F, partial [Rhizobiales bacterium]|nr:hydrogenase 4 subunit F [Hyphomicrobiales bacterium]
MSALWPFGEFDPLVAVLAIPAVSAIILVAMPGYWLAARFNTLAAFATLVSAVMLLAVRPPPGNYLFIDDLNNI